MTPGKLVQAELQNVILSVPQTSNFYLSTDFGTTIGTTWNQLAIRMTRYLDATALTADNFKEGMIYIGGTGHPTGTGQNFKIKAHTGVTASSTEYVVFTFDDEAKPEVAFTTDATVGICKNSYDDVIQVVTGAEPTAPVVGLSICTVASGDYFWAQTWGKAVAYVGAATTVRAPLVAATDAAVTGLTVPSQTTGGDSAPTMSKNQVLAVSPNVIAAGCYAPVELCISP
jgi:hypothetical protein